MVHRGVRPAKDLSWKLYIPVFIGHRLGVPCLGRTPSSQVHRVAASHIRYPGAQQLWVTGQDTANPRHALLHPERSRPEFPFRVRYDTASVRLARPAKCTSFGARESRTHSRMVQGIAPPRVANAICCCCCRHRGYGSDEAFCMSIGCGTVVGSQERDRSPDLDVIRFMDYRPDLQCGITLRSSGSPDAELSACASSSSSSVGSVVANAIAVPMGCVVSVQRLQVLHDSRLFASTRSIYREFERSDWMLLLTAFPAKLRSRAALDTEAGDTSLLCRRFEGGAEGAAAAALQQHLPAIKQNSLDVPSP